MFSNDFTQYFESDKYLSKSFRGVFSIDQIPKTIKVGQFYICNTATSDSVGEHWFVVYRPVSYLLECFDSLSTSPDKTFELAKHLRFRGISKVKFNSTKVQADHTDSCGQHCIFFVFQRLYNNDLRYKELLNEIYYADNLEKNERNVKLFVDQLLTNNGNN